MPRTAPRTAARIACAAFCLALAPCLTAQSAPTLETLRRDFLNPPDTARPMVRWWWFGPAVVKPEILRELQQMKASGIQGAELAFVYAEVLDDPAHDLKNLPFLSPEMLDAVTYAQAEGRKLGLRIDVTLCSGWPYGGPATPLAEAVTRIFTREVPVPANATSVTAPTLAEGESFLSAAIVNSIAAPPAPPLAAAPATPAAPPARGRNAGPQPATWDVTSAKPLNPAAPAITASDKPRTALFFIASHTKQQVKRAAVGAEGYVLDPFSHDAVATHLRAVGEPLVKAFGATPPYAIFSDSLEAYGADWTPTLPAEFRKRRGYDLMPHLPELVAGGTPAADTIRHDYGRTLTELVDQNYLTQINDWAVAHHTKFRSQTYGEPAVSFSSQAIPGLAEGEGPQWRAFSTLRWATSANHVFNHEVTSGETFTWLHSPVFRATPLDMKTEADIDFVMGENQLIFHGFPYSAPGVPEPGWSLYAAASFNNHNPWHPVLPAVTQYIARISYLLRQGSPANQVAILLPTDDAWASFAPGHTTVTGAMTRLISPALMSAVLSGGYNIDYIDADAIEKVGLGAHTLLILPPTDRIPAVALHKIYDFVKAGGKAIAVGRAPSMDPEGKVTAEITTVSNFLFDPYKMTLVPDEARLASAILSIVRPDFITTPTDNDPKSTIRDDLGFIRRKLPNADIYFVANTTNHPVSAEASFTTTHKFGEQWDPDHATATPASNDSAPLALAPYESRIFVFSDSPSTAKSVPATGPAKPIADLTADWNVNFTAASKQVTEATLTDWTADPATRNYSGVAVYSRDFNLAALPGTATYLEVTGGEPLPMPHRPGDPPALLPNGLPDPRVTRPGPGMHAYFDPPIREAALVTVNGQSAGALWHPPYRLDVSKLLKPGKNHIEISVYNTALNAWAALPPHDYAPLIAKYGDKFQMQDLNQVAPIPSGLLGQIHLVTSSR